MIQPIPREATDSPLLDTTVIHAAAIVARTIA
jgi:hypothetical protein